MSFFAIFGAFCSLIILTNVGAQNYADQPNVIILMSDDQDLMLGSMDVMQATKNLLASEGATFSNAFTTSPICCPSRSSFLTGLYSHNHNVLTNRINCSSPQWQQKYETQTFATYLEQAGYATGYFGKYLNEYNGSYIPPGWQYWMGLIKNTKYYNYSLNHNDYKESHRDNYEKDYLTDLVVNRSMQYFRDVKSRDRRKPVLAFLSFPAPHGTEDAAPQYQDLYQNVSSHITPSFDYGPNDDKHWIISRLQNSMDDVQHRFSTILQQKRLQTLRSVDDGVHKFVAMLDELDELHNTYIIYTSDHGYHIGQFRLAKGKGMPYDFDIRVPFYIRGPGISQNTRLNKIVLNIDVAPTILDMAGVSVPEGMDGRSFLPLLRQDDANLQWRDTFLVERGKIPHTKIHLAKPRLPSKQEKVVEECRKPQYKYPCDVGQKWTCPTDDSPLKIRKCNKYVKKTSVDKPKKGCSCLKKAKRTSATCHRRVGQEVRGGRNKMRIARMAIDSVSASQLDGMTRNISILSQDSTMSTVCKLSSKRQPRIECVKGSQKIKPAKVKSMIKNLKMQVRILSLFLDCRTALLKKCKCSRRTKKKKQTPKVIDHPMKSITLEMNKDYAERLQRFKELRIAQQSEKPIKKDKTNRRTQSAGRCSFAGMTCFRINGNRWLTKPTWDGPERCYCTGSNNNTYWCIRTINETANLLYCEFITGFVEYYDLNTDPHQLSNTYHDLPESVRSALYDELAQLRVCNGSRNCHINHSSQPLLHTTSTAPSVVTQTHSTAQEFVSTRSPDGGPAPGRQLRGNFSRSRQPPFCSKQLKRENLSRWRAICSRRRQDSRRRRKQQQKTIA